MNFRNLTISDIKKYYSEGGSIEKFYSEYMPWLKEQDKEIHGFLTFTPELVDKTIKKLKSNSTSHLSPLTSKLWGIPIAIKDCIMVAGEKCTAGSKILENYVAPYSATDIKKLQDAGAVIVGKTNMDEFAMGSSTENSAYGPTLNPFDKTRVPGGSSGGSAAVVGAGMIPIALGSDTGGSIRQPAGFCETFGLKPTYGSVSRYGLIAMASSLDQIGVLANNLEDLQIVYDVIKGQDEKDSTSIQIPASHSTSHISNFVIGLPTEFFDDLNPEIKKVILNSIKKSGLKTKKISLPSLKNSLACYYLTIFAEISANLARFDGIRYSPHTSRLTPPKIWDVYLKSRKQGLGKEVQRRIILGTFILSHGYYDAYYGKAQKLRRKIFDDFQKAFKEVDLIASPISPTLPFKLGEKTSDPLEMYLSDIFTVPVNLAYLPAMTIPAGFLQPADQRRLHADSHGLPIGFQIIGNLLNEELIIETAKLFVK